MDAPGGALGLGSRALVVSWVAVKELKLPCYDMTL